MENSPLADALRTKDTYTENGALTNSTSLNYVLDLFFIAGASRKIPREQICSLVHKAMAQDKLLTLKVIFWAGNIRGGAGERRFFKIALDVLHTNYPAQFLLNFPLIPEFSRWDLLFNFYDDPFVIDFISNELQRNNPNGLLCKWLPRQDYSKKYGYISKKVRERLNLTGKKYRKLLVKNTKVVESDMCKNNWGSINYESVPSVAMNNYISSFYKHDEERFDKYIEEVKRGTKKIHSGVLFPHNIVGKYVDLYGDKEITEAEIQQWNNLPNYLNGKRCSILPVCDVSGSMTCDNALPLKVSVSLGLYISERNEGPFKDCFMTFSAEPRLVYLKGSIMERLNSIESSEWGMNTDLEAVFKTILRRAVEENVKQEDMPENILIISDMEFDEATTYVEDHYDCGPKETNYEVIEKLYKEHDYELPNIIYWNVAGRAGIKNVPVTIKDERTALVSGFSPSILTSILSGKITPMEVMMRTISAKVYDKIRVAIASTFGE